jgi:opacity protein-like surface antigen
MKPLCFFAICYSMTGLAQTPPTSSTSEAPDRDLSAGRIELRMFGGINTGSGRELLSSKTPPSLGVEGAVGLNRYVAAIGVYTRNGLGYYTQFRYPLDVPCRYLCGAVAVKAGIHEFLGGFRVSAANRSLVTPYAEFGVGPVRPSASAAAAGVKPRNLPAMGLSDTSGPTMKFAAGAGGGLKFKLTRDLGVDLDVRAVKAMGLKWFFTPTLGFYVRFH